MFDVFWLKKRRKKKPPCFFAPVCCDNSPLLLFAVNLLHIKSFPVVQGE